MLYNVVLIIIIFKCMHGNLENVAINIKANEHYFTLVLFAEVITYESVKEILRCDYSNESN